MELVSKIQSKTRFHGLLNTCTQTVTEVKSELNATAQDDLRYGIASKNVYFYVGFPTIFLLQRKHPKRCDYSNKSIQLYMINHHIPINFPHIL